jgi:hypothetical protein
MIKLTVQPVILDRHVLTLDEAGLVEAPTERSDTARIERPALDESDHRHRGLLRTGHQRPRSRRTAEQSDELAPLHSITSSARC